MLAEHACDLEQRRVPGRVVADALVPGVEVPVNQHEPLRLDRAPDLRDEDRNPPEALLVLGHDRRVGLGSVELLDEARSVGIRHRDDQNAGPALVARQVGRAPDGGADPLVDALAR